MNEFPGRRQRKSTPLARVTPATSSKLLAYESPRDRLVREPRANVIVVVIVVVVGFAIGAASTLCATGIVYSIFMLDSEPATSRAEFLTTRIFIADIYMILTLVVFRQVSYIVKAPGWRTIRRWEVLGMLLGAGTALLIGGICVCMT